VSKTPRASPRLSRQNHGGREYERLDDANQGLRLRQRALRLQRKQRRLAKLAAATAGEQDKAEVMMDVLEAEEVVELVFEAAVVEEDQMVMVAHSMPSPPRRHQPSYSISATPTTSIFNNQPPKKVATPPPVSDMPSIDHDLPQFWVYASEDGVICIRDQFRQPCLARSDEIEKGLLIQAGDGSMYCCDVICDTGVYRLATRQRSKVLPSSWDLRYYAGVMEHPEQELCTSVPRDLFDAAAHHSVYLEFHDPRSKNDTIPSPAFTSYLRNVCKVFH
jgi:hypothetical protein